MSRARSAAARGGLGLVALLLLYLLLGPLPADPVAWSPPSPRPPAAPEVALEGLERIGVAGGRGPETIARGPDGWLYTGVRDGRILKFRPGDSAREVVDTGGRPLGLAFDAAGRLVVADRSLGLLRVLPGGTVETLVGPHGEGGSLNGVAVAPGGRIYATVPSRLPAEERPLAVLASRPSGRLLAHDPDADSTWTALDSLHYPNGVAVAGDGTSLLVAETSRYRVLRYRIAGPRAGESEAFATSLPGFPDGLSVGPDGHVWTALAGRRSGLVDALHPRPRARAVLMRALRLWPLPAGGGGLVLRLAPTGAAVESYRPPERGYGPITSALAVGPLLYLGSYRDPSAARARLRGARRGDP